MRPGFALLALLAILAMTVSAERTFDVVVVMDRCGSHADMRATGIGIRKALAEVEKHTSGSRVAIVGFGGGAPAVLSPFQPMQEALETVSQTLPREWAAERGLCVHAGASLEALRMVSDSAEHPVWAQGASGPVFREDDSVERHVVAMLPSGMSGVAHWEQNRVGKQEAGVTPDEFGAPDAADWAIEVDLTARGLAHARVSLTAFVDTSVDSFAEAVAASQFGEPRLDVHYADNRGFSMGHTLRASQAVVPLSLQSRALAMGVWMRVVDFDCVRSEAAASWDGVAGDPMIDGDHDDDYDDDDDDDDDTIVSAATVKAFLDDSWLAFHALVPPSGEMPLHTHEPGVSFASRQEHEGGSTEAMEAGSLGVGHQTLLERGQDQSGGAPGTTERWSLSAREVIEVPVVKWSRIRSFAKQIMSLEMPVILRGTCVSDWAALERWRDPEYLASAISEELPTMENVMIGQGDEFGLARFFTVDRRQVMSEMLGFDPDDKNLQGSSVSTNTQVEGSVEYVQHNLTQAAFWDTVFANDRDAIVNHFAEMSDTVLEDVQPNRLLFASDEDAHTFMQYFWIGSAGSVTHTHYDMDNNFYAQVVGRKTFYFSPPFRHEDMFSYPRLHPLWHKSQVHFEDPAQRRLWPEEGAAAHLSVPVLAARLVAGDVLYVPPFWWHTVEAQENSISLASFSRVRSMYAVMNQVYDVGPLPFDADNPSAAGALRRTMLRMYIDELLERVVGVAQGPAWAARLVRSRYAPLTDQFAAPPAGYDLCGAHVDPALVTPALARDTLAAVNSVADLLHVLAMRSPQELVMHDILFAEYLEELVGAVVPTPLVLSWWVECFSSSLDSLPSS